MRLRSHLSLLIIFPTLESFVEFNHQNLSPNYITTMQPNLAKWVEEGCFFKDKAEIRKNIFILYINTKLYNNISSFDVNTRLQGRSSNCTKKIKRWAREQESAGKCLLGFIICVHYWGYCKRGHES